MEWLRTYPYLAISLGMLTVPMAALALCRPALRRAALLSGLLATPFAFSSVLVVPEYWNPRRLVVILGVGIEDLLFSFITGTLACMCALIPWQDHMEMRLRPGYILAGYLLSNVCGLSFVFLAMAFGSDPMTSVVFSFVMGTAILLTARPALWRVAVSGCLGFTVVYLMLVGIGLWAAPDFLRQWNQSVFWGRPILGIPIGEAVWALGYGAVWPLFLSILFQIKRG